MALEAIAAASSIAGLLSLAGSVASAGYAICSRAGHSADDLRALTNEVAAFSGLLLAVKARIEAPRAAATAGFFGPTLPPSLPPTVPSSPVAGPSLGGGGGGANVAAIPHKRTFDALIADCRGTLTEICELQAELSTAGRIARVVKGQGREERLARLMRRIEQYKSYFMLCFQLDFSSQSDLIQQRMDDLVRGLEDLSHGQQRMAGALDSLVDAHSAEAWDAMIEWLGTPTKAEHSDICQRRDGDSAEWILSRPEFTAWRGASESSFLWVSGTQGCGKSVTVSKIVDSILDKEIGPPDSVIAYHYCTFKNDSTLSPVKLIGSFTAQLLEQVPLSSRRPVFDTVDELYKKHKRKSTVPGCQDLRSLFTEISGLLESMVFLVIDGLDEMSLSASWDVMDFIEHLPIKSTNFKVLIASRTDPGIKAFTSPGALTVTPDDIAKDIELFARKRLTRRRRYPTPQLDEIVRELVARADGMFQWVACQVDYLVQVRSDITTDLLRALPAGLDQTYEQTFSRLSADDLVLARRILTFVLFANSPLSLLELTEAIAVYPSTQCLVDVKRRMLQRPEEIFDICGSLIRRSPSTKQIELAHHSVFAFLTARKLEDGRPNRFFFERPEANVGLLRTCVRYLNMDDVCFSASMRMEEARATAGRGEQKDLAEVFSDTAFVRHAVEHWPSYLRRLSKEQLADMWDMLLLPFFRADTGHFKVWAKLAGFLLGSYRYPDTMTPLHIACLHELKGLAELLVETEKTDRGIKQWGQSEPTVGKSTPLHVAIENGNDGLLEHVMLPHFIKSADEEGRTPLHVAVEMGNETAVTLLVSAEADVDARETNGRTAVFIAIENGWSYPAPLLTELADPEITMPDGRGLLHLAAQAGSAVWAASILGSYPNLLNIRDELGWTPLHYAVEAGSELVVALLLAKCAFVAMGDKEGWTPLHAAVRRGRDAIATMLLVSTNPKRPDGEGLLAPGSRLLDRTSPEAGRASPEASLGGPFGPPGAASASSSSAREGFYRKEPSSSASPGFYRKEPSSGREPFRSGSPPPGFKKLPEERAVAQPPLVVAVTNNHHSCVNALLDHAESFGEQEVGLTPRGGWESILQTLATSGEDDTEMFELLLRRLKATSIELALPDIALRKGDIWLMDAMKRQLSEATTHLYYLPKYVSKQNFEMVRFVLDQWPPSETSRFPSDIVHLAAKGQTNGHIRVMDLLIERLPSIYLLNQDDQKRSLLEAVVQDGLWAMGDFLIVRGVGSNESPVLHAVFDAALKRRRDMEGTAEFQQMFAFATRLVDNGTNINGLNEWGMTICYRAVVENFPEFMEFALRMGADPAIANLDGELPLWYTVSSGSSQMLRMMVDRIAGYTSPERAVDVIAPQHDGRPSWEPPFVSAVNRRERDFIVILLQAARNTEGRLRARPATPDRNRLIERLDEAVCDGLCHTIGTNYREGFDYILGCTPDPSGYNSRGYTPLHVAVQTECVYAVQSLLGVGADSRKRPKEGRETPRKIAERLPTTATAAQIRTMLGFGWGT